MVTVVIVISFKVKIEKKKRKKNKVKIEYLICDNTQILHITNQVNNLFMLQSEMVIVLYSVY